MIVDIKDKYNELNSAYVGQLFLYKGELYMLVGSDIFDESVLCFNFQKERTMALHTNTKIEIIDYSKIHITIK